MKVIIKKDWEGFLAEVEWHDNVYAYWETESDAKNELLKVIEMMMDFHLEQVENDRKIKNHLLNETI